ncbi:Fur family transcriptional regulator [Clostridium niameyense]|uniref:Fur family transcriptional regulator n=1 Tax=Clostridium niameyense TaxID=1622073 RepID=UPI00067E681B|nr:Fur family transcriptional regulator [Clostridium niameyense]
MELKKILKQNNLKATKARMSILEILINKKHSLDVEGIYSELRNVGVDIDVSTIYRTLEVFKEKNIVGKFDLGEGKYNYKIKEDNHKHIIECKLCHKEVEIDCPMVQIEELINKKTGFSNVDIFHEKKVKGICEDCAKKR